MLGGADGGTFDQAFLLQSLHRRPSADELFESVLHTALVGAVGRAVFQLGAAENICGRATALDTPPENRPCVRAALE